MMWWAWIVFGAVVLGAELFVIDLQFYLVFIGLSAMVVGVLDLAGLSMPYWAQWLTFGALSLITMLTFRKALYVKLRGGAPGFRENVEGDTFVITMDLAPGADGTAQLRGAAWQVRNTGTQTIPAGARARVLRTEGLTIHVELDQ